MLDRLWQWLLRRKIVEIIYGKADGKATPYLMRIKLFQCQRGVLMLHKFYRGDEDPDPHDHPWNFWTFPLCRHGYYEYLMNEDGLLTLSWVPGWRWTRRDSYHTHLVVSPSGPATPFGGKLCDTLAPFPMWTLVWCGPYLDKTWGFWVKNDNPVLEKIGWHIQDNPCVKHRMKVPWRTYVYGEEQRPEEYI